MRRLHDLAAQLAGLALFLAGLGLLGLGGFALAGVIGRFGLIGWFVYAIVMTAWAMFAVPLLVAGHGMREAGSPARRRARERRLEEQRRHFGLVVRSNRTREAEDTRPGD